MTNKKMSKKYRR